MNWTDLINSGVLVSSVNSVPVAVRKCVAVCPYVYTIRVNVT